MDSNDPPYWSTDKKQQARNRIKYHGLRCLSLQVINKLIGKAIEEAADTDAIKAARQFAFGHRECIYRASAQSHRALQLTSTFPLLAVAIYSDCQSFVKWETFDNSDENDWRSKLDNFAARKRVAADLVERGARLRDVAAALDVPMALRHIKPGVAHLASKVFCQHPEYLRLMPEALPRSRIWLRLVSWAHQEIGADFAEWVARNVPQIPGRIEQVASFLLDIADWVKACRPFEPGWPGEDFMDEYELKATGRQFVVRPFTPSMSLTLVTKLSADWHEAVASRMDGPQFDFPAPWYPPAEIDAYEILPIDNSAALYREGAAMHHCVGTYGDKVKRGEVYVYSVRRDGVRLATLELARENNRKASLIQIRGPCNAEPPKQIMLTVRRWLREQPPLQLPRIDQGSRRSAEEPLEPEIPF